MTWIFLDTTNLHLSKMFKKKKSNKELDFKFIHEVIILKYLSEIDGSDQIMMEIFFLICKGFKFEQNKFKKM